MRSADALRLQNFASGACALSLQEGGLAVHPIESKINDKFAVVKGGERFYYFRCKRSSCRKKNNA